MFQMICTWDQIARILSTGLHAILYGPPGTGKTHLAVDRAAYSLTLTAETPAAELRGHYVPKGSEFVWQDGPALRAWREGARLVLNEIDQASGDALTFLYAILDDPETAMLTLPTGETVRPAPGFQAVATTNRIDLANVIPAALLDRFAVRIHVTEPHPSALSRLPKPLSDIVSGTLDKADDRRVSLRQALAYHALHDKLNDARLAAMAVFGERAEDVFNSLVLALAGPESAKKGARK